MDTNEVCKRIKTALQRRSGKAWSVTHGTGTAYGWITIKSPPKRMQGWEMSCEDREELRKLLGLRDCVHQQGESVPSGGNYHQEYLDRAEGRKPTVYGEVYWD